MSGPLWNCPVLCLIRQCFVLCSSVWLCIVLFCPVHKVPVKSCIVWILHRPLYSYIVWYGLFWSNRALCGFLWSCMFFHGSTQSYMVLSICFYVVLFLYKFVRPTQQQLCLLGLLISILAFYAVFSTDSWWLVSWIRWECSHHNRD